MGYISLSVYKSGDYDCTLNGISVSKELYIEVPRGNISKEEIDNNPNAVIVKVCSTNFRGNTHYHLKEDSNDGKWRMAGGNFGWSHDSRFPFDYPLAIHDRIES